MEQEMDPHRRIARDLRERIRKGEWLPGGMLPGRTKLAAEYEVAPGTIHKAIQRLKNRGLVRAESGRGTFVAERTPPEAQERAAVPHSRSKGAERPVIGVVAAIASGDVGDSSGQEWEPTVMRHMEAALAGVNGSLSLYNVNYPSARTFPSPTAAYRAAVEDRVDAVAVVNVFDYPWAEHLPAIQSLSALPTVLIWGTPIRTPLPHLQHDQWYAGYQAVEHLLEAAEPFGYRRFLFVQPFDTDWAAERVAGARAAVRQAEQAGISLRVCSHPPGSDPDVLLYKTSRQELRNRLESGVRGCLEELDVWGAGRGEIGVIGSNDDVALAVLDIVEQMQLAPGRDIGVIGFDDRPPARLAGLSSMRPPLQQFGRTAARMLLKALEGEPMPIETRVCSTPIGRPSTQKRAGSDRVTTASAAGEPVG
jgi:DNA-binding LacI/PurR family transcriptional regulator